MKRNVVNHSCSIHVRSRSSHHEIFRQTQPQLGRSLQIGLHSNAAVDFALENGSIAIEQDGDALDQVNENLVLAGFLGLGIPGNGLVRVIRRRGFAKRSDGRDDTIEQSVAGGGVGENGLIEDEGLELLGGGFLSVSEIEHFVQQFVNEHEILANGLF